MTNSDADTDDGVTITVTVNRAELATVAGELGTRTDAETVEASLHGLFAAAIASRRKAGDLWRLTDALDRHIGVIQAPLSDETMTVFQLKSWRGKPTGRRLRELRAHMREIAEKLPDVRLVALVQSDEGTQVLALQGGDLVSVEEPDRALLPAKGISADQFAALFEGDEPIDPDRFRSDLDRIADPSVEDPYDRARGVQE